MSEANRRLRGARCAFAVALAMSVVGCKRPDDPAARPPPDAALAPRPRPAEVAHLTLKVLGMT